MADIIDIDVFQTVTSVSFEVEPITNIININKVTSEGSGGAGGTQDLQSVTDVGATTDNSITITIPEPTAVPFYTNNFSSGFGDFVQSPNNDTDWSIVSNEAKSGIIPNNGKSGISLTKSCPTDVTILQYTYRTSTEQDYDYLFVILDGVVIKSYSGNISTTTDSIAIQKSGNHTIQFVYSKDNSAFFGDDTVWLDNVSLISGENALTVNKSVYFKDSLYLNNVNAIGSVSAKTIYANLLDIRNENGDKKVNYGSNGITFYEPTQNAQGNYFIADSTTAQLQVKIPNGTEIFKALGTATTAIIQIPNPNASVHIGQFSNVLPSGYMFNVAGTSLFKDTVTATSFIKSGGGANELLAANGDSITAGTNITISGGTISSTGVVPYTGAVSDVNLGEFGIQLGNLEFDNTPTNIPTTAGSMYYNDADGTLDLILKGGNVTLQIGQEQVVRVVNKTATNIDLLESNYQAVRITGAQGQRMKVDLAQATNDVLSSETIGLVTETIANNQEGFVTTSGIVRGINTTGSLQSETWLDGDILYLSPTVAGRITKVKPTAPDHLIIIGYVIYAHVTQGTIFVKVDNGYELNELHNVKINGVANNNVLAYTLSTDIWENKTVEAALGYTPYNSTNPSGYQTASQVQTIADAKVVQTITNGITATAPSQDAVFDALALKQDTITLTTTGTSGASTLVGATLNIPQYSGATNLGYTAAPTNGTVTSSTGTSATITLADATNAGLLKPAKFTVLENTSGTNTGDQDLSSYALLASPTFTGTPSLPTGTIATTQTAEDSSTKLATTAFVTTADNLKQDKSLSAYKLIANNTNATANGAEQVYKDIAEATDLSTVSTISWIATTAPTSPTSLNYKWNQIGSLVTARFNLNYTNAGTTVQQLSITLPNTMPTPLSPTGYTAANDVLYQVIGNYAATKAAAGAMPTSSVLRRNAANNGYELVITRVAAFVASAQLTVQYFT